MTEEEIEEATKQSVDLAYFLKRVFDLFEIDYYNVDCDSELVLRKMMYVFQEMPPVTQKEQE